MRHSDLPRVLRRLVGSMRFARETAGASAASCFLVSPDGRSLDGLVSEWDWTRTSFRSDLTDWPTVARALVDGRVRVISAGDAAGAEIEWFERRGITSTLCVPLHDGEQAFGVLFFDFDRGADAPTAADVANLAEVGRRSVRALARAPMDPAGARSIH